MSFVRLSDIRPLVMKKAGRFYTGTADSSGNTTTALADADLRTYPDNFFNRLWIMITSGTNNGTIRYVDDFVNSTGIISWVAALPNAAEQSTTYELFQYDPAWILDAIADAARTVYPQLSREFFVPVGVGGSPLPNPSFEWFSSSGVPIGWTATTLTTARSSRGYRSPSAVTLSTAMGDLRIPNTADTSVLRGLVDKTITLNAMVRPTEVGHVRLRLLDEANGQIAAGSYNAAISGAYEKVTVSGTITASVPAILVETNNSTACQVDTVWIEGAETDFIYVPRHVMPNGPSQLFVERGAPDDVTDLGLLALSDWNWGQTALTGVDVSYDYLRIGKRWYGRVIWAKGTGVLSVPTSQTDTTTYVEISEDQQRLLVCEAALVLLDRVKGSSPSASYANLDSKKVDILQERRGLDKTFGSSPAASLPPFWR